MFSGNQSLVACVLLALCSASCTTFREKKEEKKKKIQKKKKTCDLRTFGNHVNNIMAPTSTSESTSHILQKILNLVQIVFLLLFNIHLLLSLVLIAVTCTPVPHSGSSWEDVEWYNHTAWVYALFKGNSRAKCAHVPQSGTLLKGREWSDQPQGQLYYSFLVSHSLDLLFSGTWVKLVYRYMSIN